jgi:hypothetical protein
VAALAVVLVKAAQVVTVQQVPEAAAEELEQAALAQRTKVRAVKAEMGLL